MRWTYICVILLTIVSINCKRKKKHGRVSNDPYYKSDYYFYHYYDDADFTKSEMLGTSDSDNKAVFDFTSAFMKQFVFKAATMGPSNSLVCSPISALLPIGKLVFGASGQTLAELLRAIGVGSVKEVDKRIKKHLRDLRKLKGATLTIVSRLFLNKNKKLLSEFKEHTKSLFKSSVQLMDINSPHTTGEDINSWIKRKTKNKISEILSSKDLMTFSINTNLLLVNAVHFKGQWKYPFTEYPGTFRAVGGDRTVPMMHVTHEFQYGYNPTLDAKVIKVPYDDTSRGAHAYFVIVLPNSPSGLGLMMNELRLAPTLLNKVHLKKTRVSLTMPRFTVESEIEMDVLYKMIGLHNIFNSMTGLQQMVKNGTVKVDVARQKVVIELTAEGRQSSVSEIGNIPPQKFEATHPFLYFVISKHQQVLAGVFTGN